MVHKTFTTAPYPLLRTKGAAKSDEKTSFDSLSATKFQSIAAMASFGSPHVGSERTRVHETAAMAMGCALGDGFETGMRQRLSWGMRRARFAGSYLPETTLSWCFARSPSVSSLRACACVHCVDRRGGWDLDWGGLARTFTKQCISDGLLLNH